MCEHCGHELRPGKLRENDKKGMSAKDGKRFCGFCKMNYNCCLTGLHSEGS